jgi:hypothetical protein
MRGGGGFPEPPNPLAGFLPQGGLWNRLEAEVVT